MSTFGFWQVLVILFALAAAYQMVRLGQLGYAAAHSRYPTSVRVKHQQAFKLAACMLFIMVVSLKAYLGSSHTAPVNQLLLHIHWMLDTVFFILALAIWLWLDGEKSPERHKWFAYPTLAVFLGVFLTGSALFLQAMQ